MTITTRNAAIQCEIGMEWKTIGYESGCGSYADLFEEWVADRAGYPIVELPAEHGFPRFSIGLAQFRLVPCRKGEVVL